MGRNNVLRGAQNGLVLRLHPHHNGVRRVTGQGDRIAAAVNS